MSTILNIIHLLIINRDIIISKLIYFLEILFNYIVKYVVKFFNYFKNKISYIIKIFLNLMTNLLQCIKYCLTYFWKTNLSCKILLLSLFLYLYNFIICMIIFVIFLFQFFCHLFSICVNFYSLDFNSDLLFNILNIREIIKLDSVYNLVNIFNNESESKLYLNNLSDCLNNGLNTNTFSEVNSNYTIILSSEINNVINSINDISYSQENGNNTTSGNSEASSLNIDNSLENNTDTNFNYSSTSNNLSEYNLSDVSRSETNYLSEENKTTNSSNNTNKNSDSNNSTPNKGNSTNLIINDSNNNSSNNSSDNKNSSSNNACDNTTSSDNNYSLNTENLSINDKNQSTREQNIINRRINNTNYSENTNISSNVDTNRKYNRYVINFLLPPNGTDFTKLMFNLDSYNDSDTFTLTKTTRLFDYSYRNPLNILTSIENTDKHINTTYYEEFINKTKLLLSENNSNNISLESNNTSKFNIDNENNKLLNSTSSHLIRSNSILDTIDKGEGSSKFIQGSNLNSSLSDNFKNVDISKLVESDFRFYFPEDRGISEIFSVKNLSAETYLGAVDLLGNIHLSADILDNPLYKLVPGVDFIEGFDSFVIYDHDSEFFKPMIDSAYKAKQQDVILDFFDSQPDTWYNVSNKLEANNYIIELIKRNSENLAEFEHSNSPNLECKLINFKNKFK